MFEKKKLNSKVNTKRNGDAGADAMLAILAGLSAAADAASARRREEEAAKAERAEKLKRVLQGADDSTEMLEAYEDLEYAVSFIPRASVKRADGWHNSWRIKEAAEDLAVALEVYSDGRDLWYTNRAVVKDLNYEARIDGLAIDRLGRVYGIIGSGFRPRATLVAVHGMDGNKFVVDRMVNSVYKDAADLALVVKF